MQGSNRNTFLQAPAIIDVLLFHTKEAPLVCAHSTVAFRGGDDNPDGLSRDRTLLLDENYCCSIQPLKARICGPTQKHCCHKAPGRRSPWSPVAESFPLPPRTETLVISLGAETVLGPAQSLALHQAWWVVG